MYHLCARAVRGALGELHQALGAVVSSLHEPEGLEHGLVVLGLVLQDHVVDEAVPQERIVTVEVGPGQGFEDQPAHGVEVGVGAGAVEEVEGRALLPGVERGVVHIVELAVGELATVGLLEEPKLLVVSDVPVVPDGRAHDGIVLGGQILTGDRREQHPCPFPRLLHISNHALSYSLISQRSPRVSTSSFRPHAQGRCGAPRATPVAILA
jgi:hypothetical protein